MNMKLRMRGVGCRLGRRADSIAASSSARARSGGRRLEGRWASSVLGGRRSHVKSTAGLCCAATSRSRERVDKGESVKGPERQKCLFLCFLLFARMCKARFHAFFLPLPLFERGFLRFSRKPGGKDFKQYVVTLFPTGGDHQWGRVGHAAGPRGRSAARDGRRS